VGEYKNAYKKFVRKLESRKLLWRTVDRWGDNIEVEINEKFMGVWVYFIWRRIRLIRDFLNVIMNVEKF
jgi:hypothetical protein